MAEKLSERNLLGCPDSESTGTINLEAACFTWEQVEIWGWWSTGCPAGGSTDHPSDCTPVRFTTLIHRWFTGLVESDYDFVKNMFILSNFLQLFNFLPQGLPKLGSWTCNDCAMSVVC